MALLRASVLPLISVALKEDIGSRDLTSAAIIPKGQWAKGDLVFREEGVVAGIQVAEWVFSTVDAAIRFKPMVQDGQVVYPDKVVAFIEGPARGVLAAERTALNFLSRLSGIATLTRAFVEQVKRCKVQIMDTRKTTPGLRLLEKYAVAMGGGTPHRMGLYDQVLIKDNHLQLVASRLQQAAASGTVATHRVSAVEEAVKEARSKLQKDLLIEVEVNNLQEFRLALSSRADIILLDNMKFSEMEEAVRLRNAVARSKKDRKPLLEASGGITLQTVEAVAATGVDRISVGALTDSALSIDLALEILG